mmetsp:Transcript_54948/g.171763  ORF Transcript_54948/g.171763 Transcript_54948/m.171763 type:complete len:221 (+) Transcript_54948:129-791(+)
MARLCFPGQGNASSTWYWVCDSLPNGERTTLRPSLSPSATSRGVSISPREPSGPSARPAQRQMYSLVTCRAANCASSHCDAPPEAPLSARGNTPEVGASKRETRVAPSLRPSAQRDAAKSSRTCSLGTPEGLKRATTPGPSSSTRGRSGEPSLLPTPSAFTSDAGVLPLAVLLLLLLPLPPLRQAHIKRNLSISSVTRSLQLLRAMLLSTEPHMIPSGSS